MEKTPPNSSPTSHEEVKSLLINGREEKPGCSSTSEEPKVDPDASNKRKSKSPKSSGTISPSPSTSRNSPDPCCAICLEPLQNKSFTNSCLHMFCFKCLVEWSKIKPECPLCKQQFKSIIHNVQEDFQYDTYYIKNRSTESYWNFSQSHHRNINSSIRITASPSRQRFRYRTTLTTDRLIERTHTSYPDTLQIQIENHRRRFAPHSVSVISTSQTASRIPSVFRRSIYEQNLWVKPSQTNRFRIASPDFFKRNPACTHRLLPWLNRELIVLLHNIESQIVFVLELIMALITRYEITSQEFFMHIEPYLLQRTRHFIHEFYNFASSPFDMEVYDSHAMYEPLAPGVNGENSSENSDVITLDSEEPSSNETPVCEAENSNQVRKAQKRKDSSNKNDHIEKMVIKRNRETDSWVTVMGPLPLMHDYSATGYYANPGPSTSTGFGSTSVDIFEPSITPLSDRSAMISPLRVESSDEECEILEVVKPKAERTPEIVDLSSDEEGPAVVNISSGEENSTDYDLTDIHYSSDTESAVGSPSKTNESSSDIECVYESKQSTVSDPNQKKTKEVTSHISSPGRTLSANVTQRKPAASSLEDKISDTSAVAGGLASISELVVGKSSEGLGENKAASHSTAKTPAFADVSPRSSNITDQSETKPLVKTGPVEEPHHQWSFEKPVVSSKIVVPNTNGAAQNSHSFWNVSSNIKKHMSSSQFDNISTESDTEIEVPQTAKRKKLKLRSVVAHFSFDNSDERQSSSHRSSHKKHKDKKKKKKHNKKHKRRIYSDSDSSS